MSNKKSKKWEATLKHGRVYTYRDVAYNKDETRTVDDETKRHLEETAIDTITITSGSERSSVDRCKFQFVEVVEKSAPKKATAPADAEGGDSGDSGEVKSVNPPARR